MYLQDHLHLKPLSFANWCKYIKFFGQCNFLPLTQNNNVLPLLKQFQADSFKNTLSTGAYSFKDAARLFYGLSLLDCRKHDPLYVELAEEIFTNLKSKIHNIRHFEISEIFHAFHYFSRNNPKAKQWELGPLADYFKIYANSLCADDTLPSKTQQKIYQRLKKLYPNIRQEVFIKEAGRKVDFVIGDIIIQYNGARRHYVYDNNGKIVYRSSKELLGAKTLKKVVCIDRISWDALEDDEAAELDFLSTLISKAIQENEKIKPSDNPDPFFPKPLASKPPTLANKFTREEKSYAYGV
jgi:hypothetical protein